MYLRVHCQAKQIIASEGYAGLFGREPSSADCFITVEGSRFEGA